MAYQLGAGATGQSEQGITHRAFETADGNRADPVGFDRSDRGGVLFDFCQQRRLALGNMPVQAIGAIAAFVAMSRHLALQAGNLALQLADLPCQFGALAGHLITNSPRLVIAGRPAARTRRFERRT